MMRRRAKKKAVSLRDYSETGDDSDLQNARKSPREVLGLAWNVGNGCCGIAPATGVDDVDFIAKVMADIGKDLPYDKTRVYATGMSTGGLMAYRLFLL